MTFRNLARLTLLALVVLGFCLPEPGVAAPLPQAPAVKGARLPQAPPLLTHRLTAPGEDAAQGCACVDGGSCSCADCACVPYRAAYRDAVDSGKLFVAFVGCMARKIPNCATCRVSRYRDVVEGGPEPAHNPCVVVADYQGGTLRQVATLEPGCTDAAILSYRQVATPVPVLYQPQIPLYRGPVMGGFGCGRGG
jgi:hypothetical protein